MISSNGGSVNLEMIVSEVVDLGFLLFSMKGVGGYN